MKQLKILILLQLLVHTTFGQLDSDFIAAKHKADRCFNGNNFDCAILHYTTAIAIKENDDYCKKQIEEAKQRIAYKKNKEVLERKREQEKKNQIIKITQEEEKANRPYYGTLNGLKDDYGFEFNYTGNITNLIQCNLAVSGSNGLN